MVELALPQTPVGCTLRVSVSKNRPTPNLQKWRPPTNLLPTPSGPTLPTCLANLSTWATLLKRTKCITLVSTWGKRRLTTSKP